MGKADVTDKEKIFRDSIGQKATVQREKHEGETATMPNQHLIDLGLEVQRVPEFKLEHYRYLGSAAVHVFQSAVLGQIDIVSQAGPLVTFGCPEDLAAKAAEDLIREMKERYGKRTGKLRSGF